jgi:hypothetical protein
LPCSWRTAYSVHETSGPDSSDNFRPCRGTAGGSPDGTARNKRLVPFGTSNFSDYEWTVNGGFAVKMFLSERVFVSPEARIGFEPLIRFTGSIGFVF